MSFRPTVAEISRKAIRHNFSALKRVVGEIPICAIVKADAYGHHGVLIARELGELGVQCWGVHSVDEGLALRKAGILGTVLVLGGILPNELQEVIHHGLVPAIHDRENLRELLDRAKSMQEEGFPLGFHLKLDTGMGRFGVRPEHLDEVLSLLSGQHCLRLEGVFAHVPRSEDSGYTLEQKRVFDRCRSRIADVFPDLGLCHHANSFVSVLYPEMRYQLVRPGLALYGVYPHEAMKKAISLEPVMRLVSRVIAIRDIPAGVGLSYGHTFVTRRPSRIATLPVGYADGYPRACGNQMQVMIRGKALPVVGRVCMDMMLVDITDGPEVRLHDRVLLFGRERPEEGGGEISVCDLAQKVGTISYEVLCGISPRVPRVLVE